MNLGAWHTMLTSRGTEAQIRSYGSMAGKMSGPGERRSAGGSLRIRGDTVQ
jgi:hypothetical protein